MSLNGLRTALGQDESFARLRAHAAKPAGARSEDLQIGAPVGLRAALIAEMVDGLQSGIVLAVTATGREAEDLAAALEVDGELGSDVPRPGAIAGLQTAPNALMQLHPPGAAEMLVQHLGV